MSIHIPVALLACALTFSPSLCVGGPAPSTSSPPGKIQLVRHFTDSLEKKIGPSSQVLLVGNANPAVIDVHITPWERKRGAWQRPFASMEGVIGRNGFAPPGKKREGDGRTPAGTFPLGTVFGYGPSLPTRMPYRQATVDDLWIDDVQAADYNRWVRRGTTKAASFERMKRDDVLYKYGIIVEYNTNPVIKGYGSAIFFHLWRAKGVPTSGCIALSEDDLLRIIKWLDPAARPLVVLGAEAAKGDI
jgi:L,D-peptidoglycan transpeptidase YkuD (ErfK/YbiS/YcfS/YnhG family)